MIVIKKDSGEMYSLAAKEISHRESKLFGTELAYKILKSIAEKPMYPIELAKELKVHEQKIYYYIKNFFKAGLIKVVRKENIKGSTASYYSIVEPAFVIKFKDLEKSSKVLDVNKANKKYYEFLQPFVVDGRLDALIVVGSPDPHGPELARSRDGYYGMDLALFLGTFLSYVPEFKVKLDTEVRENDLQNNLILIGGPVVNKVTEQINEKLPIKFFKDHGWNIKSFSGNTYPEETNGIIVKTRSPFNKDKYIIVVAGRRHYGTRAAIMAFLKNFDEVCNGNVYNRKIFAKVVEGVDLDSDGIIDNVKFLE